MRSRPRLAVSSDTLDPDHSGNTSTVSTGVVSPAPTVPTLSVAALAGVAVALSFAGPVALRR
jgi:hypothetical protein